MRDELPSTQPELGEWIARRRELYGYSLAEVAVRAGLTKQGVHAVESGRVSNPSYQTVNGLHGALRNPSILTPLSDSETEEAKIADQVLRELAVASGSGADEHALLK